MLLLFLCPVVSVCDGESHKPKWNQYLKRKRDGSATAESVIWAILIDKINYNSRKARKWKKTQKAVNEKLKTSPLIYERHAILNWMHIYECLVLASSHTFHLTEVDRVRFVLFHHFEWLLFQFNGGLAIALLFVLYNSRLVCLFVCLCVWKSWASITDNIIAILHSNPWTLFESIDVFAVFFYKVRRAIIIFISPTIHCKCLFYECWKWFWKHRQKATKLQFLRSLLTIVFI